MSVPQAAASAPQTADEAASDIIPPAQEATDVKEEAPKEETKPETSEKPAETSKEKPVEQKFDLKLPEGSQLDRARVEELAQFAKENGLTPETAQKILDAEHKSVSGYVEKQKQTLKTESEKWISDLKSDPEVGGEAFDENIAYAHRAVEKYGGKEFKDQLEATGLGNHPMLVKTFVRIGKAMASDKIVRPNTEAAPTKKSIEELMFPSMFQESNKE